MKKKKFLTVISLIGMSTILVGVSAIPFVVKLVNSNQHKSTQLVGNDKDIPSGLQLFQQKLIDNSYNIGNQKYYKYDNQVFYSEEELNEYIFNNQQIQVFTTSSNPSKIIKDYEHETLDETKIYDTNIKNFVQVYEMSSGNITLNRENALRSFLSVKDILKEYSYDGVRWYDDEIKAQRDQKRKVKVNKSLYYMYDNRYYNAFNSKDIDLLLSKMKEGYYFNYNKTLSGTERDKVEIISGQKQNFADLLSMKFKNEFYKSYHQKLIDFNGDNALQLTSANKSVQIVVRNNGRIRYLGNDFTLKFGKNKFKSYFEMIQDFKDLTKWKEEIITNTYQFHDYNGNQTREYVVKHKIYKRSFPIIIDGFYHNDVEITLEHKDAQSFNRMYGYDFDFEKHLVYKDRTVGTINYYLDEEKMISWNRNGLDGDEMNNLYDPELTNDQMSEFYNKWFDYYLNETALDFGVLNNQPVTWADIKNKSYIKNDHEEFHAGDLFKDKMYEVNTGKGYTNSLIESMLEWETKKAELIAATDAKDEPGTVHSSDEKRYPIVPNFLASSTDLDNFLFLQGVGVDSRVMYSVSNEEHASDLTGKWLAPTEVQAKELWRVYNIDSLRMRYSFYNNEGKLVGQSYSDDLEMAINYLRNEVRLNSRFVHKNDLKNFDEDLRPKKWVDLVSTGRYTVYKIKNPLNNKGIWFKSEHQALEALKVNLKVLNSLEELKENYLVYNFLTSQGIILPIRYHEHELEQLSLELYLASEKSKE